MNRPPSSRPSNAAWPPTPTGRISTSKATRTPRENPALQALRLQRKGFKTTVLLYGPGVTLGVQRGFPKLGDEAFPGAQNFNNQLTKFMTEGGEVYACRFALQALYGHGEPSLIPGIRPINPLDVLDLKRWDCVRVAPQVIRGFEGGPDGLEIIAIGADRPEGGDGELVKDWWTD